MEIKVEVWKDIEGYEGLYQVSNLGRVKALERIRYCNKGYGRVKEHIMKQTNANSEYYRVPLTNKEHIKKYYSVHRLVAMAFIKNDNPTEKTDVNHKDGNKANNNVDNLEWCTRTYNIQHAFKNGLNPSIKYVYGELLKLREEFEEFKAH